MALQKAAQKCERTGSEQNLKTFFPKQKVSILLPFSHLQDPVQYESLKRTELSNQARHEVFEP
ncbi:MAG: hypothetical protein LBS36_10540 [Oscillospiraceae bacterium]|nr:hypothetical protein [Oscillospiraceae bacterium]